MKLLIIKHGALGDIVRTSYFVDPLRRKYPNAEIHWVTCRPGDELLAYHPGIARVWIAGAKGEIVDGDQLTKISFDLVLSLDDEIAATAVLSRLQIGTLIGAYHKDGKVLYTPDAATWFDMGLVSRLGRQQADRLKCLNQMTHTEIFSRIFGVACTAPSFYNSPVIEERYRQMLLNDRVRVALNLSAGKRWASKSLRPAEAVRLIKLLERQNTSMPLEIYLTGGSIDQDYNNEIFTQVKSASRVRVLPVLPLMEFAAAIRQMHLLISSDSLAMHMAIAQKVFTVCFFAPTSAAEIDLFGHGGKVVSLAPDYCSYKSDADTSTLTAQRISEKVQPYIERMVKAFSASA